MLVAIVVASASLLLVAATADAADVGLFRMKRTWWGGTSTASPANPYISEQEASRGGLRRLQHGQRARAAVHGSEQVHRRLHLPVRLCARNLLPGLSGFQRDLLVLEPAGKIPTEQQPIWWRGDDDDGEIPDLG